MFKNKKIVLGIILVLIIISLLIGISINNRNIIQKQLKETEKLAETNQDNSYITTADHLVEVNASVSKLTEFKSAIASAITEKGVETSEEADIDTMVNNIRNIKSGGEPIQKSHTITITGLTNGPNDYGFKTYYTGTLENIEGYTPYTAYIYSTNTYRGGVSIGYDILQIATTDPGVTSDKTKAYVNVILRNGMASDTKTTIVLNVLYLPN